MAPVSGGAKLRKLSGKTRASPKDDLPIYALKRLEGPMLPATETPAAVEDITEFERQSAVEIVQAYRSATSQNKAPCPHTTVIVSQALASGHSRYIGNSGQSEQYVLELLGGEAGSAIPVL